MSIQGEEEKRKRECESRFLMNVMLVTGNHPWRIVTVEERTCYMAALEKASIEGDITDFAKVIMEGIYSSDGRIRK